MTTSTPPGHLLHIFPSFAVGGVENRIVRIINAMGHRLRHTIVALDGKFNAASNLRSDLHVGFETLRWRKTRFLSAVNLRNARSVLGKLTPDLLLTYNWGTTEWALAARFPSVCPHIHFESGFGADESPQRQHWRRIVARRLLLAKCNRIVVPSLTLYDVATRVWRIARARVVYIPNGVDCDRFGVSPDDGDIAALGIADGFPVVGTIAALRPEKNLMRLLRAFSALPPELHARLVIAGDGPEKAALSSAVANLGIAERVIFSGYLPDPARILGRFDVFALSSDTEQMPNSVLEAMAAGLAVASTDVGDIRRMLSAENALFCVQTNDEAALTHAMACLLQDRVLARRLGYANQGRARAEFSLDAMVARYDELYTAGLTMRRDDGRFSREPNSVLRR